MNDQASAGSNLEPGTYVAQTAGLVIGVVGWPSSASPGCVGYALGQTGGMTVYATGGNLGAFGPAWSSYQASNGNSFTLPVSAGATFSIAAAQVGGSLHQADAPIWFYWVPQGADAGAETCERTGPPPEDLELPPAAFTPDEGDAASG
jgi:hypothetical protein